jgi:hypothetical protein
MGIGVQALKLTWDMQRHGLLDGVQSVAELGSQTFAPDVPRAREALGLLFPEMNVAAISTPRDLFAALGVPRYVSIDLDGHDGALPYNLNMKLSETYGFTETFDFVTNHGTTEHAFDQMRCFENVHDMTRAGGLMLHALPSQGYQNHGFFNYHPSFLLDLASANGYEVLGLWYNIDEALFAYTDDFLALNTVPATEFVAVFALLRKVADVPFIVPFDGRYYREERDGAFVPRSDVGSHGRVLHNSFPLSGSYPTHLPGTSLVPRAPLQRFVLPVWGEAFVAAFLAFGLRSQTDSGCLDVARTQKSEYIIVTDAAGAQQMADAPAIRALRRILPVRFIAQDAPAGMIAYERLTHYYNLALSDAVAEDIYFFLTSDCFFSREVFTRARAKLDTQRLVLCPSLRVVEESFVTDIAANQAWNLSGRELLEAAMRHEHPLTEAWTLDNPRNVNHPLPAQMLARVPGGYVGRWTVMHPLAMRIGNTLQPIASTIDWNYGAVQVTCWADVAVLDSIEDGLTVSTTPLTYDQDQKLRHGASSWSHLTNLKNWVNIPWALEFHLAQVTHPIRLLSDPAVPEQTVAEAEARIESVIGRFVAYVNSHRRLPRSDFHALSTTEMLRPAIDRDMKADGNVAGRPRVRFVQPVWGADFVSAFLAVGLRVQLENGSFEAFHETGADYIIVTDEPGAKRLANAPQITALRGQVTVDIRVAKDIVGEGPYPRLTRHYNIALEDAEAGDIYFFLTADTVVSREVFRRTIEKLQTHRVVLAPTIRVVEESFISDVTANGAWSLTGPELMRLALRHEHPLTEAYTVNNPRSVYHPLPAQVLGRVRGGYVGRWMVSHPMAMRISNTTSPIQATVDWNFGALQSAGWSDIAFLDSLEDGLSVTLTPLAYDQGTRIRDGKGSGAHFQNLRRWVNIPWPLEFHLAQVTYPIRLLSDPDVPAAEIAEAEARVEGVVGRFIAYVNSRRRLPRPNFQELTAIDLLRPAIDNQELVPRTVWMARAAVGRGRRLLKRALRH